MNIVDDKLATFHQFQIVLIFIFKSIKKLFYNFICSSLIMISTLSLFECTTHTSLLPIEEIKLFTIVD